MTSFMKCYAGRLAGVCTLIAALAGPLSGSVDAAVFPADPAQYWDSNVVYYQFQPVLERIGVCTPEDSPVADCDTGNGDDDCTAGQTCEPLGGRCVPTTMPDWPDCRVDADCDPDAVCNELSGKCLGRPLPGYVDCDQDNPVACGAGENCLPKGVANVCIAMQLWGQVANLIFIEVGCTDAAPLCPFAFCQESVPTQHINFNLTYGDPTSSYTGMHPSSSQSVGVNPGGNFAWGFVHEVGHALGLDHEMQRDDRGTYIDVYTSRVVEGKAGNYNVKSSDYYYPVEAHGYSEPFDFDSIMMYPLCVYSDCNYQHDEEDNAIFDEDTGEPVPRTDCDEAPPEPCCDATVDNTCRPIDPVDEWASAWSGSEDLIGQRSHFSKLDALTMSFLYPSANWRFVDWTSPFEEEEGTFLRPNKTFLDGVDEVPEGGILFVQPGSYDGVADYTKPMTIRAPIGPVHLGD